MVVTVLLPRGWRGCWSERLLVEVSPSFLWAEAGEALRDTAALRSQCRDPGQLGSPGG